VCVAVCAAVCIAVRVAVYVALCFAMCDALTSQQGFDGYCTFVFILYVCFHIVRLFSSAAR